MKVTAFGFNLQDSDYKTIEEMICVISDQPPQIYDLQCYDISDTKDSVVLLYGSRAAKAAEDIACTYKVEFPDITKLDKGFGDEEEIRLAYEKLDKVKDALASGVVQNINKIKNNEQPAIQNTTTEDSLPDLDASQVLQLEATLKHKGIKEWLGNSKDGKSFRITLEPEESTADINLTFAELYGLKMAMETLHAEELQIVYKPSSRNRQSNT